MKKLTVLLLLFAFSLGCLAACNESVSDSSIADESSKIAIFDVESSAIETAESSEAEEDSSNTDKESSETEEIVIPELIVIPEFDMKNVIYCDLCSAGFYEDVIVPSDGEIHYGFFTNGHNYTKLELYVMKNKNLLPNNAYFYIFVMKDSSTPAENFPQEPLKEFLECYGFIEDVEKTNSLEPHEGCEQGIVGYLPFVAFAKLRNDCKELEYDIYYTWLSENCLGENCEYYYQKTK